MAKPKRHAVDPADWKDDGKNPANIPSLHKSSTPKPHKKLKVKKMPDVLPALEQLFEAEDGPAMPIDPPPQEVNETKRIMDQVTELVSKKGKRISEQI